MGRFKPFTLLHNHTVYSLLDGVTTPKEWLYWCLEKGIPGISFTEHGNAISFHDIIRFKKYIQEYNEKNKTNYAEDAVIGVPGVEFYVKINKEDNDHYHMCVWAVNNTGYANLMKLCSLAFDDIKSVWGSNKGRVTLKQLQKYREGLKFGTGCLGSPMGVYLNQKGDWDAAEDLYKQYIKMFGNDLYVEFHASHLTHTYDRQTKGFEKLDPHPITKDQDYYTAYNKFLFQMVNKYGGKPIPVTDAHFIYPEDKKIQDVLLINGSNGWHYYHSVHQKSPDEIYEILKYHLKDDMHESLFEQWCENANEISTLAKNINIETKLHLPKIDIPLHIKSQADNYDEQTFLLMLEKIKSHGRWNGSKKYVERFQQEIDVIMKNKTINFIPYFLVLEDICGYATKQGQVLGVARGSAGGCLIAYYLKIINVDPLVHDLPFERFLSHSRIAGGSWPDIDCDFEKREDVALYLQNKYGLGFAQVCTFLKLKTKAAIKDAMYAIYGRIRTDIEVNDVCKTIADSPQGTDEYDFLYGYTDKEGIYHKGEVETNDVLADFFKRYPDIEILVKKMIGVVRGWGRHAAAVLVSTVDLANGHIPTMRMKDSNTGEMVVVTQFDGKMCEANGFLKMDLLGLNTLQMIGDCLRLIKERHNLDFLEEKKGISHIYKLPDDKDIFEDFYKCNTDSSFQFNTDMVKQFLPDFNPKTQDDLAVLTALIRPGALDAPFLDTTAAKYYVDVRNGRRSVEYIHPDLEPILAKTNAVFCFQEQIMKFFVDIVGYSMEKADIVRAAIGKKKLAVIQSSFEEIRVACEKRGWTEDQIDIICQQIQAFASYSFNLSHSVGYSKLGYITMYLKHYFYIEWWTSVLNSKLDNSKEDDLRLFISLLGGIVKQPSLKSPSLRFTIQGDSIYPPINMIKGIGDKAVEDLVAKAPFTSAADFVARIDSRKVNTGTVSLLIMSGAMDEYMDPDLPYIEAKRKLCDDIVETTKKHKKKKIQLKIEVYLSSYIEIFKKQKQINMAFYSAMLDSGNVINECKNMFPFLKKTKEPLLPFRNGKILIPRTISTLKTMFDNGYSEEVGMILILSESIFKTGVSAKTGREWKMYSCTATDGMGMIEVTCWDFKHNPNIPDNTVIYIEGRIEKGFKTDLRITTKEIKYKEEELYDEAF